MHENISDMKYAELQKLAKQVGIRANMKSEKLREALISYQNSNKGKEKDKENVNDSIRNPIQAAKMESKGLKKSVSTPLADSSNIDNSAGVQKNANGGQHFTAEPPSHTAMANNEAIVDPNIISPSTPAINLSAPNGKLTSNRKVHMSECVTVWSPKKKQKSVPINRARINTHYQALPSDTYQETPLIDNVPSQRRRKSDKFSVVLDDHSVLSPVGLLQRKGLISSHINTPPPIEWRRSRGPKSPLAIPMDCIIDFDDDESDSDSICKSVSTPCILPDPPVIDLTENASSPVMVAKAKFGAFTIKRSPDSNPSPIFSPKPRPFTRKGKRPPSKLATPVLPKSIIDELDNELKLEENEKRKQQNVKSRPTRNNQKAGQRPSKAIFKEVSEGDNTRQSKQAVVQSAKTPSEKNSKDDGTPNNSGRSSRRSTYEKAPTPNLPTPTADHKFTVFISDNGKTVKTRVNSPAVRIQQQLNSSGSSLQNTSGVKNGKISFSSKDRRSSKRDSEICHDSEDKHERKQLQKKSSGGKRPSGSSNDNGSAKVVDNAHGVGNETSGKGDSSQIPRFAAFARKQGGATPGVKDWAKIHEREFNKMDSIDAYLQKKRKRNDDISLSMKKARLMADEAKQAVEQLKATVTTSSSTSEDTKRKLSMKSLGFEKQRRSSLKQNSTRRLSSGKRSLAKRLSGRASAQPVFVPSVTSVGNMNLSFAKSPRVFNAASKIDTNLNSQQKALIARKSLSRKSDVSLRKSVGTDRATPFKLGNMSMASQTSERKKFDLQESLQKKLTYQPHKGKLKPFTLANPTIPHAHAPPVPRSHTQKAKDIVNRKPKLTKLKEAKKRALTSQRRDKRHEMQMKQRAAR